MSFRLPYRLALSCSLVALGLFQPVAPVVAADGTWQGPGSDINNPANWTVFPSGGNGTFAGATPGIITFSAPFTAQSLVFSASSGTTYAFVLSNASSQLTLTGAGIVNNTTGQQAFSLSNASARLNFQNAATAADASIAASAGIVNFQNSSSAARATLTINGGTADFLDSSTAGAAAITVASGSVNFFNTSTAGTSTILNRASFVSFNDNASAGNATIATTGNTTFFDTDFLGSSTAGTATFNTGSGGRVFFNNTANLGTATFNNSGTVSTTNFVGAYLTLYTTATITTPTIVNNLAGMTFVALGTNLGNSRITNNNGGILNFLTDTSSAGNATIINNNGGITSFSMVANNGGLLFGNRVNSVNQDTSTDKPSAATATITNNSGGATYFFAGSTGGTATIINNSGGILDISGLSTTGLSLGSVSGGGNIFLGAKSLTLTGNADAIIGGVIADGGFVAGTGGALVKQGSGTLTLTGNNTYTGGTTISGGTLQVGNGGTTGSLSSGAIIDNAALAFNRSGNVTVGAISGTGSVAQTGTGTLILAGANSYAGGTSVASGTLQLAGFGTLGAASGTTTVTGTLDLGGTTQTQAAVNLTGGTIQNGNLNAPIRSIGGALNGIGGPASLTTTAGTTIITGTNTYSGAISVNGGTLKVNGSIVSAVTVANGGTLGGGGTTGPVNVTSGGALAPGNSIGTLSVSGNLSFAAGSLYQAEVNESGQADRINVSGSAALNGATLQVLPASGIYRNPESLTILSANGGVTGTFATVSSPGALTSQVSYGSNSVVLTVQQTAAYALGFGTPNQVAAGTAIENGGTAGGNLFATVIASPSVAAALAGFDASSGEIHATLLADQFDRALVMRRLLLERMRTGAADAPGWTVWGSVSGDWGNIDGDGNAASARSSGVDLTVGADTRLGENWRAGLEGGFDNRSLGVPARSSSADVSTGHMGAYAYGRYDQIALRAGLSYDFGTARTLRGVDFAGFNDAASASQDTDTVQLLGEAGYDLALGKALTLQPFVGLDWTQIHAGDFHETGGSAALTGLGRTMDNGYVTLGGQLFTPGMNFAGGELTPLLRAGWQHGFAAGLASRALTLAASNQSFTVFGTPLDQDQALVDLGASLSLDTQTQVSLGYAGAYGAHVHDNAIRLRAAVAL